MKIFVSGLLNTETTVPVRGFPIPYYPIDYPFFGVNTAVSGVAFNIAKALRTLGNEVCLCSMTGSDFAAAYIRSTLTEIGIDSSHIASTLKQTPASVVLYDPEGKRQIYCDLKDIQEAQYGFDPSMLEGIQLVAACNTNFNRPLLHLAKRLGKTIATDVHVLSDIYDDYNREFLEMADILFLSDEAIGSDHHAFLKALSVTYPSKIIVLGRGSKGAAMYLRESDGIIDLPAARAEQIVNTVGAGDALFSGFLHCLSKGFDPVEALRRAQVFAARKIGFSGAANGFITDAELEGLLS